MAKQLRTGLEISVLFRARTITGIPRIVHELSLRAPHELVFFAGDKLLPDALARRLLATPGPGPDLDAWLRLSRRPLIDTAELTHAVYPLWRLPRKIAAHETSIICDLTPVLFPDFHLQTGMHVLFPRYVLGPLPYSDRIVCISRATADDLAKHAPRTTPRLRVAHLGLDHLPKRAHAPSENRRFLMVGSVEPRKNVPLALEWFFRSAKVRPTDELRIAGGNGWGVDFEAEMEKHSIHARDRRHRVLRITELSDETLAAEYAAAYCLLYPSQYEGFGLPPVEAMTYGTPAIVSNNSSLPEVCGDAAVYLQSTTDWRAIDTALDELDQRGPVDLVAHAARFRWQSFAATVFA